MKATILAAVLMPYLAAVYAQGCTKACLKIDINNDNNPCGHVNQHPGRPGCQCLPLGRAKSNDLYTHERNTKVEIYNDNSLHMFCHDSGCFRDQYCRIEISYRDADYKKNDGSYQLPSYGDCCTLPSGYIDSATMYDKGY